VHKKQVEIRKNEEIQKEGNDYKVFMQVVKRTQENM
jgi:hypothetical protein